MLKYEIIGPVYAYKSCRNYTMLFLYFKLLWYYFQLSNIATRDSEILTSI